jgi:hypothetical protein
VSEERLDPIEESVLLLLWELGPQPTKVLSAEIARVIRERYWIQVGKTFGLSYLHRMENKGLLDLARDHRNRITWSIS